jgi:hypothetical protein
MSHSHEEDFCSWQHPQKRRIQNHRTSDQVDEHGEFLLRLRCPAPVINPVSLLTSIELGGSQWHEKVAAAEQGVKSVVNGEASKENGHAEVAATTPAPAAVEKGNAESMQVDSEEPPSANLANGTTTTDAEKPAETEAVAEPAA